MNSPAIKKNESMLDGRMVFDWYGEDQNDDVCVTILYIVTIQAENKMANKTVIV